MQHSLILSLVLGIKLVGKRGLVTYNLHKEGSIIQSPYRPGEF
jgi:hypothetical protein